MKTPCVIAALMLAATPIARAELIVDAKPAGVSPRASRVLCIPTVEAAPTIDGKLDEPVWRDAPTIGRWTTYPTGASADVEAVVRMLTDRKHIYIAWTQRAAADYQLKKPTGGDEYGGSLIEIFLDPQAEGMKQQIVTNPLGLRYDAYMDQKQIDYAWRSAATIDGDTWTVEIAMPMGPYGKRQYYKGNVGLVLQSDDGTTMQSWTGGWGAPATDYGVLFFGTRKQYLAGLRPRMSLHLDRAVYDVRDQTAVALARIDSVDDDILNQLQLQLQVRHDGNVVAEQTLTNLQSPDIDLTLDVAALPVGNYELTTNVINASRTVATAAQTFARRERNLLPPAQPSGRIPIRVHPQRDLTDIRWPITTGVPFAQSSLVSPDHVRLLDPSGNEVPCQTAVRSTWSRRGSVQWLGLDFIPALSNHEQTYTLEYGPDVRAAATTDLRVDTTDQHITVDTGPLKFTVNRRPFALIDDAWFSGEHVIHATGGGLSLVDHEGNRYLAALDRDADVVIEQQGPVRATIRATGWYVKQGSTGERTSVHLPTDRLCQFTVRLSAFAGSPLIKAAVSTTLTQDTDNLRLRELSIGIPIGQNKTVHAGNVALPDDGYLLQHRWDKAIDHRGVEHDRGEGWIASSDVAVAVRRFWQLFPNELGYRDGALTFHPWPAHGIDAFALEDELNTRNIYKLWYAHEGKEMTFKLPEAYVKTLDEGYADKSIPGSNYYKAMEHANAQGMTIHNDLLIAFGRFDGATLAQLVNADPHAMPDPAYACATGALGPILHAAPQFAKLDDTYKRGFDQFVRRAEPAGEFGKFIHGNTHNQWHYNRDPAEGSAAIHRVWANGHYQLSRIPLVHYARSADPMWMQWGRDHINAMRDIAMINYVSDERTFRWHQLGAMYHCKGFAPWAGDATVAGHPMEIDFLILDYFINGNQRSRDVIDHYVQGLKALSPGGFGTREGVNAMAEILQVYKLTWDAGLVEILDNFRRANYIAKPIREQYWYDYNPLLFTRDYLLTGHSEILEGFRDAADHDTTPYHGMMNYDGFLAIVDNDPARLEPWQTELYRVAHNVVDRPGHFADGYIDYASTRIAYLGHKYPYALKGLAHFDMNMHRPVHSPTARAPSRLTDNKTYIAVKETADRAFDVNLTPDRKPPMADMQVRITRDDGIEIAAGVIPKAAKASDVESLVLTVPSDGRAAQYLIEIAAGSWYDTVTMPTTNLQHEVAVLPQQTNPHDKPAFVGEGRWYLLPPGDGEQEMHVRAPSKYAFAAQLLDGDEHVLNRYSGSAYVTYDTGAFTLSSDAKLPLSIYITHLGYFYSTQGPLIFALRPEALFEPSFLPLQDR